MEKELQREVNELKERLEKLENFVKERALTELASKTTISVLKILSLPEHLRMTASAVIQLGKATASDVSKITGRERTLESAYLNELVRLGHVRKSSEGRKVYYEVRYAIK